MCNVLSPTKRDKGNTCLVHSTILQFSMAQYYCTVPHGTSTIVPHCDSMHRMYIHAKFLILQSSFPRPRAAPFLTPFLSPTSDSAKSPSLELPCSPLPPSWSPCLYQALVCCHLEVESRISLRKRLSLPASSINCQRSRMPVRVAGQATCRVELQLFCGEASAIAAAAVDCC